MDGGVQLLGLAPDATQVADRAKADASWRNFANQAFAPPAGLPLPTTLIQPGAPATGWANMLKARVMQAAGLDVPRVAADESWASRLKTHALNAGWDRVQAARVAAPVNDPITAFTTALATFREQLDHERLRADAAETQGRDRVAAAEARVQVAERALRDVQAMLAQRDGEVAQTRGRITEIESQLSASLRRADQSEQDAKAHQLELRRLRARGLWARIFNND